VLLAQRVFESVVTTLRVTDGMAREK
jgi:hypothetical protein